MLQNIESPFSRKYGLPKIFKDNGMVKKWNNGRDEWVPRERGVLMVSVGKKILDLSEKPLLL